MVWFFFKKKKLWSNTVKVQWQKCVGQQKLDMENKCKLMGFWTSWMEMEQCPYPRPLFGTTLNVPKGKVDNANQHGVNQFWTNM